MSSKEAFKRRVALNKESVKELLNISKDIAAVSPRPGSMVDIEQIRAVARELQTNIAEAGVAPRGYSMSIRLPINPIASEEIIEHFKGFSGKGFAVVMAPTPEGSPIGFVKTNIVGNMINPLIPQIEVIAKQKLLEETT